MKRFAALLALALVAGPAHAQSYPSWATGRDGNGYLQVDSGALGTITFQNEYNGTHPSETAVPGCTPQDRVAYDYTRDGYEGRAFGSCLTAGVCDLENLDLAHPSWKDSALRHVLIKNWNIKNAFKTNIAPHVDVTQVLDSPGWGGWFVIQDSDLRNSDDGIVQWQFGYTTNACASYGGYAQNVFAGMVVQGVTLTQQSEFVSDCQARPGASDGCSTGNFLGSWNGPNVGWFINYDTNGWSITLQQAWNKVIIVGTTPDFSFRSDGAGYDFTVTNSCSSGTCSFSGKAFGPYANIEAALAAGHAEPPFIRLSCSGWADTANCTGGSGKLKGPSNPRWRPAWNEWFDWRWAGL